MMNINNRKYTEVVLDGQDIRGFYYNPMTKVFQKEYALYKAVAGLFRGVECRSMLIDTLKLYYSELPHRKQHDGKEQEEKENRNNQEDILEDMEETVRKEVVGNVSFPLMHICQARVRVTVNADRTHTFVFTDGVYSFSVRLKMKGRYKPDGILVSEDTAHVKVCA